MIEVFTGTGPAVFLATAQVIKLQTAFNGTNYEAQAVAADGGTYTVIANCASQADANAAARKAAIAIAKLDWSQS